MLMFRGSSSAVTAAASLLLFCHSGGVGGGGRGMTASAVSDVRPRSFVPQQGKNGSIDLNTSYKRLLVRSGATEEEEGEESPPLPSVLTQPHLVPEISSQYTRSERGDTFVVVEEDPVEHVPLRVLFLSADTGGGHRASAESLAKQFQLHFPGTTYDLFDIWSNVTVNPYRKIVPAYKHLSAHPRQWKFLYHLSNTRPYEFLMDMHTLATCYSQIRSQIEAYDVDVVVSVHPTMNYLPMYCLKKMAEENLSDRLPFFTVVTDLGAGHCTWFQPNIDKMYIASDSIRKLAKKRGKVHDNRIRQFGLPIRHDFAVHAAAMTERTSKAGISYVKKTRKRLNLDPKRHVVLVMGGGEGVGSLSDIVDATYAALVRQGIHATVAVVCGRNEKLKVELEERDWDAVLKNNAKVPSKSHRKRILAKLFGPKFHVPAHAAFKVGTQEQSPQPEKVTVVGLGFITDMASYMVAADVLVTKAGPGTIAEAASLGLPIMLTSFLPGQEAGNVDVVLDGGFGDYCEDPDGIADQISLWLAEGNQDILESMSRAATLAGCPNAAAEIAIDIGETTIRMHKDAEARRKIGRTLSN